MVSLEAVFDELAPPGRGLSGRRSTWEQSSDRVLSPAGSSSVATALVRPSSSRSLGRCTSTRSDQAPRSPTPPAHTTRQSRYSQSVLTADYLPFPVSAH